MLLKNLAGHLFKKLPGADKDPSWSWDDLPFYSPPLSSSSRQSNGLIAAFPRIKFPFQICLFKCPCCSSLHTFQINCWERMFPQHSCPSATAQVWIWELPKKPKFLGASISSIKMTQCLYIIYVHFPVYFKPFLEYLWCLMSYECYMNSCSMLSFREWWQEKNVHIFSTHAISPHWLHCQWLNASI